ncbi:Uncharacterised protein [Bacteroides uniformis]|nr:Uncharacterised protein [Bacteroides uniformis]
MIYFLKVNKTKLPLFTKQNNPYKLVFYLELRPIFANN